MKKNILVTTLVFVGILLTTTPTKAELVFTKNLSFGIQGDSEVTKLQEFLADEGLYSGPITGNFFSLTLKAVKDYQTREGISPAAGYFGLTSRSKANAWLSTQIDASNSQAISETGAAPSLPNIPKTTTDAANTMQLQLDALLQQIALLQQQLQTQQQTQQTVQNLQSQVTQQTQTIQQQQQALQQIQQNITPQVVLAPIMPEIKKEIEFNVWTGENKEFRFHRIYIYYLENGDKKANIKVDISSDDNGTFNNNGDGNVKSALTRNGIDSHGRPGTIFEYLPEKIGDRTLTISANGIEKIITVKGKLE